MTYAHAGGAQGVPQADHGCECRVAGVCSKTAGAEVTQAEGSASRRSHLLWPPSSPGGTPVKVGGLGASRGSTQMPALVSGRFSPLGERRTDYRSRKIVF